MVQLWVLEVRGLEYLDQHAVRILKVSPGRRVQFIRKCLESDDALAACFLLSDLNLEDHLSDIFADKWQLVLEFGIDI